MEPLLDTMGLRGCQLYEFWEGHRIWGNCMVGYNCLYLVSLRSPVCLMSLSIVIRLFFRLLVGSLFSTLYVLVSYSRVLALL